MARQKATPFPRPCHAANDACCPTANARPWGPCSAQSVSLDIPGDGVEMVVLLNGERLETPLIEVASAARSAKGVPALRVSQCQPAHELRQLAVLSRPDQQMPMVGHQAIGQKPRLRSFDSLSQHSLEGGIIAVRIEQLQLCNRAVQDVIDVASLGGSVRASHAQQAMFPKHVRQATTKRSKRFLEPFLRAISPRKERLKR